MDGGSLHCTEGCDKNYPKGNEMQEGKWLSEEALQIAEQRRERHTQLNAEFQRLARRDQNAVFNEQCKKIEENNRMGKSRDPVKKIGDIKGIFHARMGMIKDRNRKI